MNELQCPRCGHVFQVDKDTFDSIAQQVRNKLFEQEIARREQEIRQQLQSQTEMQRLRDSQAHTDVLNKRDQTIAERDSQIALLKEQLDTASQRKELELSQNIAAKDAEIAALKEKLIAGQRAHTLELENSINRKAGEYTELLADKDKQIAELLHTVDTQTKEAALRESALREQHAVILRQKDQTIEYYKDLKQRLSTKMLGETLEQHCYMAFTQQQSMGMFPSASFCKDNDISTGTKGDFIFRDYADGHEYISIMFEMKNEADTTATRHKNTDFLEKLDKDRRDKGCEYAILVSMLEPDSELYNGGIVNVSHVFPKMFVIRPQMFMPIIALLCQAARKNMAEMNALRTELEVARAQSIDVTNFENRLNQFREVFGKYTDAHARKHDEAIAGIDKVIEALERQAEALRRVKNIFDTSRQKLVKANETVENDLTIKKMSRGNPTMKRLFDEARKQQATGDGNSINDAGQSDTSNL